MQQLDRAAISLGDIASIDAFTTNKAGAELLADQSKGIVRVLLHRSQGDGVRNRDGTNAHSTIQTQKTTSSGTDSLTAGIADSPIEERPQRFFVGLVSP
jgi:hypothetical protein